jgi:hypothetical protein
MARASAKKYRLWTPEANAQLACIPAQRLPEGDLVFFLLDSVGRLDLSRFYAPYEQEKRVVAPSCFTTRRLPSPRQKLL